MIHHDTPLLNVSAFHDRCVRGSVSNLIGFGSSAFARVCAGAREPQAVSDLLRWPYNVPGLMQCGAQRLGTYAKQLAQDIDLAIDGL